MYTQSAEKKINIIQLIVPLTIQQIVIAGNTTKDRKRLHH